MQLPDYTPPEKVGKLTQDEINAFLAHPWNARLAVVTPENKPYIVPVWYQFDAANKVFYIVARSRSAYVPHISNNPAVALHIADDVHVEHTRVFVEGTAEIVVGPVAPNDHEETKGITLSMIRTYLGEEGIKYADRTMARPRFLIKITPDRWTTWTGQEWASRYRPE